jgi:hypothetical protein
VEHPGPLIRLIAESWEDPWPVLVFADWIEERGGDPALLRWYAREVMPAILAVPAVCPPSEPYTARLRRSCGSRTLRPHPNGGTLTRLAVVAFCRRPFVWDRLRETPGRLAVTVARFLALGMTTASDRRAVRRAVRETMGGWPELQLFRSLVEDVGPPLGPGMGSCLLHLNGDANGMGDPAAACRARAGEFGYHKAVYEALARVPPLAQDGPSSRGNAFLSFMGVGILRALQGCGERTSG